MGKDLNYANYQLASYFKALTCALDRELSGKTVDTSAATLQAHAQSIMAGERKLVEAKDCFVRAKMLMAED